jgi:hypothetical protein
LRASLATCSVNVKDKYPENGKKHLWEGLNRWKKDHDISEQDMIDRILFVLQQLYLYGLTHESWCEPLHLQKF